MMNKNKILKIITIVLTIFSILCLSIIPLYLTAQFFYHLFSFGMWDWINLFKENFIVLLPGLWLLILYIKMLIKKDKCYDLKKFEILLILFNLVAISIFIIDIIISNSYVSPENYSEVYFGFTMSAMVFYIIIYILFLIWILIISLINVKNSKKRIPKYKKIILAIDIIISICFIVAIFFVLFPSLLPF